MRSPVSQLMKLFWPYSNSSRPVQDSGVPRWRYGDVRDDGKDDSDGGDGGVGVAGLGGRLTTGTTPRSSKRSALRGPAAPLLPAGSTAPAPRNSPFSRTTYSSCRSRCSSPRTGTVRVMSYFRTEAKSELAGGS